MVASIVGRLRGARVGSVALVVLWLAVGCRTDQGTLVGDRYEDRHVTYRLALPGEGWEALRLKTADLAWHHPGTGSALLVNSHCEGIGDAPLEGLTKDLLIGFSEREVLKQRRLATSRREGLETIARGKLDGVSRTLALFVVKKDGCVYDVVLDAPPEHFEAARQAFERVRDGLDIGPRRDRA